MPILYTVLPSQIELFKGNRRKYFLKLLKSKPNLINRNQFNYLIVYVLDIKSQINDNTATPQWLQHPTLTIWQIVQTKENK